MGSNRIEKIQYIRSSSDVSIIFIRDIIDPIDNLITDITEKILPLVSQDDGNDLIIAKQKIEELALACIKPNIAKFIKFDESLKDLQKRTVIKEESRFNISKILKTRIGSLVFSLGVGYVSIVILSFFYSMIINMPFIQFASSNPHIIILGGVGFASLIKLTLGR